MSNSIWKAVYEGEEGGDVTPPPVSPPPPPLAKTFTEDEFQKKLNTALAEDRRKHKMQVDQAVSQLEDVKKSKNLTEQEKEHLQQKIDELNTSLLSKEEQTKREKEKLEKSYKEQLDAKHKESESWRNNYAKESINNSILNAAKSSKAISYEQISAILTPNTRIVEVIDDNGKPTGQFTPKVKFTGTKDGKPLEMDITIDEAVKLMKEMPEKYGNLFEADGAGGLGLFNTGRGAGRPINPNQPPSNPDEYRRWRAEVKKRGSF